MLHNIVQVDVESIVDLEVVDIVFDVLEVTDIDPMALVVDTGILEWLKLAVLATVAVGIAVFELAAIAAVVVAAVRSVAVHFVAADTDFEVLVQIVLVLAESVEAAVMHLPGPCLEKVSPCVSKYQSMVAWVPFPYH